MDAALSRREFWTLSAAGCLAFFGLWTLIALSGLVAALMLRRRYSASRQLG